MHQDYREQTRDAPIGRPSTVVPARLVAEAPARGVAADIAARVRNGEPAPEHERAGTCDVDLGIRRAADGSVRQMAASEAVHLNRAPAARVRRHSCQDRRGAGSAMGRAR